MVDTKECMSGVIQNPTCDARAMSIPVQRADRLDQAWTTRPSELRRRHHDRGGHRFAPGGLGLVDD